MHRIGLGNSYLKCKVTENVCKYYFTASIGLVRIVDSVKVGRRHRKC